MALFECRTADAPIAADAALILAGGDLDLSGPWVKDLHGPWRHVIAADGGARHARALGLYPTLLVGDMDSIDGTSREAFRDVPTLTFPTAKDQTDSQIALEWALEQGVRRIVIAGGLGGRFDHSLANAQLLARIADAGGKGVVTDGRQAVYLLTAKAQGLRLRAPREFVLSVLPLGNCRGLSLRGLRWELDSFDLAVGDTRTISNEFTGQTANLRLLEGTALVVVGPPQ